MSDSEKGWLTFGPYCYSPPPRECKAPPTAAETALRGLLAVLPLYLLHEPAIAAAILKARDALTAQGAPQ